MTISSQNDKQVTIGFGITFVFFLAMRILGTNLFENNWSFTHHLYIPIWYYIIPIGLTTLFYFITNKKKSPFESILETKLQSYLLFGFFIFLFILFQFDSFLYGGGNYKINQIAQSDKIIYQFYEFGTVFFVSLFYKLLTLFEMKNNAAGVVSWKMYAYLGMIFAFVSSLLLSKKISNTTENRFLVFIVIFLGPQTLSYFGFINQTSLVTGFIYLFIYVALKFEKEKTYKSLGLMWGLAILASLTHISMLILFPALVFVTFKKFLKQKKTAFILGLSSYLIITVTLFWVTSVHFEYSQSILFLGSHNMQVRYNLFSLNHILDYLQLLFLFVPQVVMLKFLFYKNIKEVLNSFRFQLLTLIVFSSSTLIFILEPTHTIILDAPMFAVYLSPIVVMLAMLIQQSKQQLKYVCVFALFVPLLTLPSYTHIDIAEQQVGDYIEKNHYFYIEGATALQDSYFHLKSFDKANKWYISLPKKSRDYLDLTAAGEFNYAKMYSKSLLLYNQLKTKAPYWGEPRFHIASIHIAQKRFKLARPEIDTCLLISAYEKEYLKLDYKYYLEMGDFTKAKDRVLYALLYHPNDFDIKTDLAIVYYRLKDITNAKKTASEVIAQDPSQAYAYLILGFVAEIQKQPTEAIKNFKLFIKQAPEEPETPGIRKRLNNLILQQQS